MGNKSSEQINTTSSAGKVSAAFLIGGTVGSLITYYFTKRYYAKKADEAINSVTERFTEPKRTVIAEVKVNQDDTDKVTKFIEEVSKDIFKEKGPSESPTDGEPYVITVDEYVEDDEYDKETLIYYEKDGVLSDQYDNRLFLEDIFGTAWPFLLPHFGDDDEDILYCRNQKVKTDYEIVMKHRVAPETCLPEGGEDD